MIEKLLETMKAKDYKAMAELFDINGSYTDYCPMHLGLTNFDIKGKGGIEMLMRNRFGLGGYEIFDPIVLDEKTGNFFGCYEGMYISCVLTIESVRDGRINRAVVRPR